MRELSHSPENNERVVDYQTVLATKALCCRTRKETAQTNQTGVKQELDRQQVQIHSRGSRHEGDWNLLT
jgi:hypothetical protein